jgi:hypothetical protein
MANETLSNSTTVYYGGEDSGYGLNRTDVLFLVLSFIALAVCYIVGLIVSRAQNLNSDTGKEKVETAVSAGFVQRHLILREWNSDDDAENERQIGSVGGNPCLDVHLAETGLSCGNDVEVVGDPLREDAQGVVLLDYDQENSLEHCAICLEPFVIHQEVCGSNNALCRHSFHSFCLVPWLTQKRNQCPVCRQVYLLDNGTGELKEAGLPHGHTRGCA